MAGLDLWRYKMGVGLGLAVGALVVGIIAAVLFRPNMESQDMSPATLESFQVTTTDEGSVVPWLCGDVRVNTNLVWYGNLASQAITQEAGGKGGGGKDVTTGFMYWMDLWKTICLGGSKYGTTTIQAVYIGDRPASLTDLTYVFNDGTQSTYPTQPGQYSNAMNPVVHIWFPQYYLGENVSFVPTFHFVMRCLSTAPLTYANLTNGVNPAARIYDILTVAGSVSGDFNFTSFQTAADYWYGKGYGINLSYGSQKQASERIAEIFTYVDGCLRKDDENKWYLQAYDPDDPSVATFDKENLIDFSFSRRSWPDTYNDFRGNFIDETKDYTRRTVKVYNGANQRLLGYKRQRTVDLTAFRDASTASKRLSEIMRRESYPEAAVGFSANLAYEKECHVGKVITINHDVYSLSGAVFRITSRQVNRVDSNLLDFTATQVVERLWQTTFQVGGGGQWVPPTFWDVDPPSADDIFEMPYNSESGTTPAFLCLCARANQEDGFTVIMSANGTDYSAHESFDTFAQHGTLDETYSNSLTTDFIDDEVGILYTPTREDPVFETINRESLFFTRRIAILSLTEVVAFQTVTYEGGSSIRLGGVIRGLFNTPISSHNSGNSIWLVKPVLGRNLSIETVPSSFYFKFLPRLGGTVIDAGDVSGISHTVEYKARDKQTIVRTVRAVRSGSTVQIDAHIFHPNDYRGAGVEIIDNSIDATYESNGRTVALPVPLAYRLDSGAIQYSNFNIFDVTDATSFTIEIWSSNEVENDHSTTLFVGATDGTYVGPTIAA